MRLRKLAEGLLYICLLVLALEFCKENVNDYMGGTTQYSETWEPLTVIDLPTVSVCLPPYDFIFPPEYKQTGYVLGENVLIHTKVFEKEEETVQLETNKSVQTLYGIEIQAKFVQQTSHGKLPCFKISFRCNKCKEVNLRYFGVNLMFTFNTTFDVEQKFKESKELHKSSKAYFTSEENSYGVAWGKWFDGHQGYRPLKSGKAIRILEATEFQNLESTCTSESYFECLANRLVRLDFNDKETQKLLNATVCASLMSVNDICSTIPLPKVGGNEIPLCKNETQKACVEDILQKLRSSQETECKKPCKVLEFAMGTYHPPILGEKKSNQFTFGYKFEQRRWVRGQRSEMVQKIIKKEYRVNTLIMLVGSLGGTLGMFVGFSIIGATQGFQDLVLRPLLDSFKKL